MQRLVLMFILVGCIAATASEQVANDAQKARTISSEKASRDYLEAMNKCFAELEAADRQYAVKLDSSIAQAMKDGNLDLANKFNVEKKQALEQADRAKAHDPKVLPREASSELGGITTRGKRVVYLCQASGSMLSQFGALKYELKRSVQNLDESAGMEFNVIFFSGDNCFPLFKDGAQKAGDDNKKRAMDFVDNVISDGGTQPIPAIKFALAEKPDVLFLLSNGFPTVEHKEEIIDAFKPNNSGPRIIINCEAFGVDSDPASKACLEKIAKDGNGEMKKFDAGLNRSR
jgi:hypothetical protein